jgi:hypothetical protein
MSFLIFFAGMITGAFALLSVQIWNYWLEVERQADKRRPKPG